MRKENRRMTLVLHFNDDFVHRIHRTMEDEFEIASKKWGVKLNMDDKDLIMHHSSKQLQRKVAEMTKTAWKMGNTVNVKVVSSQTVNIDLPLPPDNPMNRIKLVYTKDGWQSEYDDQSKSVLLKDFLSKIEENIFQWARTAVFYGVGSFT